MQITLTLPLPHPYLLGCDALLSLLFTALFGHLLLPVRYPDREAMITDACVPLSRLSDLITVTRAALDASWLPAPIIAHAGTRQHNSVQHSIAQHCAAQYDIEIPLAPSPPFPSPSSHDPFPLILLVHHFLVLLTRRLGSYLFPCLQHCLQL
jgi:hypothetical protein